LAPRAIRARALRAIFAGGRRPSVGLYRLSVEEFIDVGARERLSLATNGMGEAIGVFTPGGMGLALAAVVVRPNASLWFVFPSEFTCHPPFSSSRRRPGPISAIGIGLRR
jgi:hypothetical protein